MGEGKGSKKKAQPVEEQPEEAQEEEQEDDLDPFDAPTVLIATIADLADWVPPALGKHGARPVWFFHDECAEQVGLFDRLPEKAIAADASRGLMDALRRFASEKADELQAVLGVTDGISFGFHTSATRDAVSDSFSEDGFVSVGHVVDGEIEFDDEESPP